MREITFFTYDSEGNTNGSTSTFVETDGKSLTLDSGVFIDACVGCTFLCENVLYEIDDVTLCENGMRMVSYKEAK